MTEWKNRIVGHADMDPKMLVPNPDNWRLHPKGQQEAMEGALDDIGWVAGITVNKNTGLVVDGHLRLDLALRRGEPFVPVTIVDLSPEEEAAVLATLDPISAMAKTDKAKLKGILAIAKSGNDRMQQLLESMKMKAGQLPSPWKGEQHEYEKVETTIKRGDCFSIGKHRIMCGDSTVEDDVAKLMGDEVASLMFTSPPYNLGVGIEELKAGKTSKYKGDQDDADWHDYLDLLNGFTNVWMDYAVYLFINLQVVAGNKLAVIEWLYNFRLNFADELIWDKQHAPPAMTDNVMDSRYERIIVLKEETPANRKIGTKRFRGVVPNVYAAPSQKNNAFSGIHNATFPEHLPTYILTTFSNVGELVVDPFLGTGTTILACHRQGRTGFGMELEPEYCELAIRQIEMETGEARHMM
jgi:DNA modification methylase